LVVFFIISYYPEKDIYQENFMSPVPADYYYNLFTGDGKYFLFNNHHKIDYINKKWID
jgi:hypothetical protein